MNIPIHKVGIYNNNFNKLGTYANGFKESTLKEILYNSTQDKLQYKSLLNKCTHPLKDLILNTFKNQKFQKDFKIHNPKYESTIRVCSKNWDFKSHFDCIKNTIYCLYGSKRFLTFDLYGHPKEKLYLKLSRNMKINQLKRFMMMHDIEMNEHYLKAGDKLIIKPYTYHRTESNESSIMLNLTLKDEYLKRNHETESCNRKFEDIWPKQSNICDENNCTY